MQPTDKIQDSRNPRDPDRNDGQSHIIRPANTRSGRFEGWGPKLFAIAFALAAPIPFQTGSAANAATCVDTPASLVAAPDAEIPDALRGLGISGATSVQVNIGPDGSLLATFIAQSSGNGLLDLEALRVAREARYAPAMSNCEPVAGSYLLEVQFA
jgi:TonB family protein